VYQDPNPFRNERSGNQDKHGDDQLRNKLDRASRELPQLVQQDLERFHDQ
jgi:hypothetical protein